MRFPPTSVTLLGRLRSPEDEAAWSRFVDLYTPLMFRHVVSRGVPPSDAADVVQEAMRGVFIALPRYDYRPDRAKFRTWLYRVVENHVNRYFRGRMRRPAMDGRTTVMAVAEVALAREQAEAAADRWHRDYQRRLFQWAAGAVEGEFKPRIWSAFWRTSVGGECPAAVAGELGMSRAAVYMARSRCVRRIQERIESVGRHEFDLPDGEEALLLGHG